jgi:hypothetical protein
MKYCAICYVVLTSMHYRLLILPSNVRRVCNVQYGYSDYDLFEENREAEEKRYAKYKSIHL